MRKHVLKRRERLRELGKQDAKNRCAFCRKALALSETSVVMDYITGLRYCDRDCFDDDEEAEKLAAERVKGLA